VDEAATRVRRVRQRHEDFRLAALIEAHILERQGGQSGAVQSLQAYTQGYITPVLSAQYIPWAAATSLLMLELPDLARAALADGVGKVAYMRSWQSRQLAASYASIAVLLVRSGRDELAAETYRLAALADPRAEFCNALAELAIRGQRSEEALSWWQTSLELDATQVDILRLAGKTAYQLGTYDQALLYLGRAVGLDPRLNGVQRVADYNALGQEAQNAGEVKRALWLWRRSLALKAEQPLVRQRMHALEREPR
jgi:tetratricopeptide (TPR) repeat protein